MYSLKEILFHLHDSTSSTYKSLILYNIFTKSFNRVVKCEDECYRPTREVGTKGLERDVLHQRATFGVTPTKGDQ